MVDHSERLNTAVSKARGELSNVVEALTAALTSVAETKQPANGQQADGVKPSSLADVLARVDALKYSVDEATKAGEALTRSAAVQEEAVLSAEKEALVRKRDSLMEEVAEKNERVKFLIDDFRDMHRDIAVLQFYRW